MPVPRVFGAKARGFPTYSAFPENEQKFGNFPARSAAFYRAAGGGTKEIDLPLPPPVPDFLRHEKTRPPPAAKAEKARAFPRPQAGKKTGKPNAVQLSFIDFLYFAGVVPTYFLKMRI